MEIRDVLKRCFGERLVYIVFDDPLELRVDDPLPNNGRPFIAKVITVKGNGWHPDPSASFQTEDGVTLDKFLSDVSIFYESRYRRKYRTALCGSVGDATAYILLGTRAKPLLEFIRNYTTK